VAVMETDQAPVPDQGPAAVVPALPRTRWGRDPGWAPALAWDPGRRPRPPSDRYLRYSWNLPFDWRSRGCARAERAGRPANSAFDCGYNAVIPSSNRVWVSATVDNPKRASTGNSCGGASRRWLIYTKRRLLRPSRWTRWCAMGASTDRLDVGAEASSWIAGSRAKGEFRCAGCGYGVTVHKVLPDCPMCRGTTWERVPWRPFSRSYPVGSGIG
jgi:hypothetical protein